MDRKPTTAAMTLRAVCSGYKYGTDGLKPICRQTFRTTNNKAYFYSTKQAKGKNGSINCTYLLHRIAFLLSLLN